MGNDEQGSVLIVVLWITIGLSVMALCFGQAAVLDNRRCAALGNKVASIQAAEGVVRYLCEVLNRLGKGMPLRRDTGDYESERIDMVDREIWLLNSCSANEETIGYGLVDEAAKLNINTATSEMLLMLPGMTTEIAAAIIDWRDSDETPLPGGAENGVYLSMEPAYLCKNSSFESPLELRLVRDVTDELLLGEDYNQNGVVEEWEAEEKGVMSEAQPGWMNLITTFSREPELRGDGEKRIDVTKVDRRALSSFLEDKLGDGKASVVLSQPGIGSSESVVEFYIKSGLSEEEFAVIHRGLQAGEGIIKGLINVNTAPKQVLQCLPGISAELALRMIDYRNLSPDLIHSVAWVIQVLGQEGALAVGPYITSSSYQYTADVVVCPKAGNGFYRSAFVIDTAKDRAQVIYRRELTEYGWPLGKELKEEQQEEDK